MPKEQIVLSDFGSMSPSTGGDASNPVSLNNVRLDVPSSILIPENAHSSISNSEAEAVSLREIYDSSSISSSPVSPLVAVSEVYVDGAVKILSVSRSRKIFVDGVRVGNLESSERVRIDVMGRQAIISAAGVPVKVVRFGYPGTDHISFSVNDIIVSDSTISSGSIFAGECQFILPLNEKQILMHYSGAKEFLMLSELDGDWSITNWMNLDVTPLHIAYDIDTYVVGSVTNIYVKDVYFTYIDAISKELKMSRIRIDDCYYGTNHSNDGNAFAPVDFGTLGIFTENDVQGVTIDVDDEALPSGATLKSIAVSQSLIFLGYSISEIGHADNKVLLEDGEDLLFSFNKATIWDYTGDPFTPASISNNKIRKSRLPWNPYKRELIYSYTLQGTNIMDTNDSSPMYIPYGITALGNKKDKIPDSVTENSLGLFAFLKKYRDVVPNGSSDITSISIPGNCGAIASGVVVTGSICIVDYSNDLAGMLVNIKDPENYNSMFPKRDRHKALGSPGMYTTPEEPKNNGAGLFYFFKLPNSQISVLDPDLSDPLPTVRVSGASALYCWNGSATANEWNCKVYTIDNYDHHVSIKKFFDWHYGPHSDFDGRRLALVIDNERNHTSVRNSYWWGNDWLGNDLNKAHSLVCISSPTSNKIIAYSAIDYYDPELTAETLLSRVNVVQAPVGVLETQPVIGSRSIYHAINNGDKIIAANPHTLVAKNIDDVSISFRQLAAQAPINNIGYFLIDITSGDSTDIPIPDSFLSAAVIGFGTNGIAKEEISRYKVSYIYDGVSSSPLSYSYLPAEYTGEEATYRVELTVTLKWESLLALPKRITGIAIYAASATDYEETSLYRLVASIPFEPSEFAYSTSTQTYSKNVNDNGSRGAAFTQIAGFSEAIRHISPKYSCQCVLDGYLFAGRINVESEWKGSIDTDNIVTRSLPYQPSAFNYTEDFTVLEFAPLVLAPFSGRIYAFGRNRYSIINPTTMGIEHTSNSCGIINNNNIFVNDNGIFVYFQGALYLINGPTAVSISDQIKLSYDGSDASLASFTDPANVYVGYISKRDVIVVLGKISDNKIIMFGVHEKSGRWCSYGVIESANKKVSPLALYPLRGSCVVATSHAQIQEQERSTNTTFSSTLLFGSEEPSEMDASWELDFGDADQRKIIYSISAHNGKGAIESKDVSIYVDDIAITSEAKIPVTPDPSSKFLERRSLRLRIVSSKPISSIRFLIRRLVNRTIGETGVK